MGRFAISFEVIILHRFYRAMVSLSEFELAIAESTSSNFNYIMNCRERVRYWQKESKLFELRSQS